MTDVAPMLEPVHVGGVTVKLATVAESITVSGEPLQAGWPADSLAAGIAVIYQELSLVPEMSVAENLFLGDMPTRGPLVDQRETRERARVLAANGGVVLQIADRMWAGDETPFQGRHYRLGRPHGSPPAPRAVEPRRGPRHTSPSRPPCAGRP